MSLLFLFASASTFSNREVWLRTPSFLAILGALDLLKVPPIIVPPVRCVSLISVSLGDNAVSLPLERPIPVETLILLLTNPFVTVDDDLSWPFMDTEAF